jgi:type II secretory pathway pseudopilin PulG
MGSRDRRATNEAGFTILESTIALAVVFAVLVGLLGALTAGARGLVTGRQRSAALALANEVMENARGRAYGDVGHDFDSDPTLATDPDITGTAPNLAYNGEPLAASAVDAGASGGTVTNPLFPFSPHKFTSKREQTTYTTIVYITTVSPATGDPYKRITTSVSWSPAQYANAARSVTLSSFLFNAGAPPDPKLVGNGEVDAGSFEVTGTLATISLSNARLTMPYVSGGIDSGFVRTAKGLARSGSSEVNLLGGPVSGCSLIGLLGASCDPALAQADADNDSGTAPPDTDQEGPNNASGGTITAAPALTVGLGSGTAQAQATARSCWLCYPADPPVGDDDRLPHFYGRATGPDTVSVDFLSGDVLGDLVSFGTSPAATVTVDRHDSGSNQRVTSTASVTFPAVDILPLLTGPLGYSGVVKVGAVSASATAHAGPGASDPSVSGAAVSLQYWNGGGYTTVPITPGVASSTTIPSVLIFAGAGFVTVSGSITSTPAVTAKATAGGAITDASASLTNWLFVDLNVTMPGGTAVNLHFDYGRLAATAGYEPVS